MKIKLTAGYAVAFLALTFLMHEAHEIVHTTVGRIICGCWGMRDFNVWDLCGDCSEQKPYSVIATFAGPVFTFMMIWIGYVIMNTAKNTNQKAFGFSLIYANIPFARFFGAATGGGDEVWGLNLILHNQPLAWITGLVIILAIIIYPLYKSFKIIENESPIVWFLVFFIIPTYVDQWVILIIMNSLLGKGLLSDYWILGSPVLVTVWTILILILFSLTKNKLYQLVDKT